MAEQTEDLLRKSKNWEVISPATLAIINYRYNPIGLHLSEPELDKLNQEISARITKSKEALLVTTILQNQVVLRMCLINPRTTFKHITETFDQSEAFATEILAEWKK